MNTPLKELLEASQSILPSVRIGQNDERIDARERFIAAIDTAQAEVNAQTSVKVRAVIDKSWDMGWEINEYEALIALAVVLEFPTRKIWAIKQFRNRTGDGARHYNPDVNLRIRAMDIIEVAQEVLN